MVESMGLYAQLLRFALVWRDEGRSLNAFDWSSQCRLTSVLYGGRAFRVHTKNHLTGGL